jgi:hypothetical protein
VVLYDKPEIDTKNTSGGARSAIMDNPSSNPTFEARRLASASGWYVRVAWSNGKRDHIPGFVSQREAQRWIEEKAPAWLSAQSARVSLALSQPHWAAMLPGVARREQKCRLHEIRNYRGQRKS